MIRILLLCLLSLPSSVLAKELLSGPISAKIVHVRDGDTVVVDARIWPGQTIRVAVRLRGIDTPEMKGKCERERQLAQMAKTRVEVLISGDEVKLSDIGGGKYFGRVLAKLQTADGLDIGAILRAEGLAKPYRGRKKSDWCASTLAQK